MKNENDQKVGNTLIDIFYMVQQETADQVCQIQNIIFGPVGGEKTVHISQLNLPDDIKNRALDLIMKDKKVSTVMKL